MSIRRLLEKLAGPLDIRDPDGVDSELIQAVAPSLDRWIERYFSLQVQGMEHIPPGPALLVGNHNSGAMFLEALGFGARWYREHGGTEDIIHGLAHDNIMRIPGLGRALNRIGAIQAGHDTAAAAFDRGRKVVVFPGGNREAFRPWRDRYKICFGDHRGFVRLALRHQVPIVPMVFVGGHSGFFVVRDNRRLAKLLRAERWIRSDTWPLMLGLPWGVALGPVFHLPLPVGCAVRVLQPIEVSGREEHELFEDVVVRMQAALDEMATERRKRPWPLRRS